MLVFVILEHTEANFLSSFVDNFILSVFWFSSGYTSRGVVDFSRKAVNILVPYAVMTAICVLFTIFYLERAFEWVDVLGAAYARFTMFASAPGQENAILMPACNSVLWFLPSFFTAFCFFALLIRISRPIMQAVGILACLALTWAMTTLPVLLPWSLDTAPAFGAVMYAGYLVRSYGLYERLAYTWPVVVVCALIYIAFNCLTGPTNISIRDFGSSVWLWYPAAVSGTLSFVTLCRMFDRTFFCRMVAWFNRGALFIFGLQLVFISLAIDAYEYRVDSWKVRVTIVLLFCFFGGKLISLLYDLAKRTLRRLL